MNKKALANIKEHSAPADKLPVDYIITSSVEAIGDKKVLFLSFFGEKKGKKKSNRKADFKVFIWDRKYVSQKLQDDGSYKWSNACLENLVGYWGYRSWSSKLVAGCYTLEERENISKFLKIKCPKAGDELNAIDSFQKKIMQEKLDAKHDRTKKRIDEAMEKVPSLPKDFDRWVYNGPFDFSRYIYYKRQGRRIMAFCTECKKEFAILETKATKRNIKHNNTGTCPKCNKKISYKALGKSKNVWDTAKFAIMQKYEDGFIVRHFSGEKCYREHYKHPSLDYWENIREVYRYGKNGLSKKKYEYANFCQTGEMRWCDDCGKIETPKAYFYTRNLRNVVKGTKWQYSCLYEFAREVKLMYVDTFLSEYIHHPAIEYLIKFKLYRFVNDKLSAYYHPYWEGVNFKGKSIKEVLGIEKPLFLQMQRLNLGKDGLDLIKEASKHGKPLNDKQVKWILRNVRTHDFIDMLKHSTPHKIIQYVQKQSSSKYEPGNVISDWCDYIRQCKELKFDINNTFILYPKNLKEKHEEYTIMNKSKGLEKYDTKVKKAFERLDKSYSYSDKKLLVRPANSVDEIVREGHKLRHCVGGTHYISGVAKGDRAIMLIRKADAPDTPFFTLELNLSNLQVHQCRGYKNCDTTAEIKNFIEKWKSKKLIIHERKKVV